MKKSFLYCLLLIIITSACSKREDDGCTIDPLGRPAAAPQQQQGTENEISTDENRGIDRS